MFIVVVHETDDERQWADKIAGELVENPTIVEFIQQATDYELGRQENSVVPEGHRVPVHVRSARDNGD